MWLRFADLHLHFRSLLRRSQRLAYQLMSLKFMHGMDAECYNFSPFILNDARKVARFMS